MRRSSLRVLALCLLAALLIAATAARASEAAAATATASSAVVPSSAALHYPATATVDQVDTYHGVAVRDPYRWLEEDVRESPRVQQWVDAENKVTFDYLAGIPERARIQARLHEIYDFEKYDVPVEEGGRYFYEHNDGLQNQWVVFVQDSLTAPARVLVDPNTWSKDGTVALDRYVPSPDGRWVALMVQDGGSDWRKVRVLELPSGKQLDDELQWVKFSGIAWRRDGSGFYYCRYPEPKEGAEFQSLNKNHTVYFHRVGTAQSADVVAYARPDQPDWGMAPSVSEDGRYLVVTIWLGTDERYQIAVQDLAKEGGKAEMLISGFDYAYDFLGNQGSELFFRTTKDAPRGRLVAIDLAHPEPARWREVVAQSADVVESATLVGNRLVARYLKDARSEVKVYSLAGALERTVELPGIGTAGGFGGHADDTETFYSYSSFTTPPTIYRYDVATGVSTPFKQAKVAFDPSRYTVEQVFYRSKDGTRVPMFLAHRKDVTPNADRPTLLYGYGGFNIPSRPTFSPTRLGWMEMGGVYAVANLRGGGEYGEEWHKAGTKLHKQNVFDDFIAAAEYLVAQGWTKPQRLAVLGGSNGGLLVGAVVNQRPDLFGAALPAVGVMDMLRFHQFTAGRFWVDDYGSADDAKEFQALYAYSPYHNVKPGTKYPAVLATTADHDDRVVPLHTFKYISALQAAQSGPAPVLVRIETRAGHGSGKPTDKILAEIGDQWAFLVKNLGFTLPSDYPAK
ncbi:MAG TPA: prolyl oligopeptidase family serine peptidase [Thermoanaerobaculia bacterium]|nr:prolyl oligopeptidase family serine peptidase [Thermoanaerobaculia bacterium]